MFKTLIKGLMMIRSVRIIVGIFFAQVGTRFGGYNARFLFLGMCAMESRETDCTVVCVFKNH